MAAILRQSSWRDAAVQEGQAGRVRSAPPLPLKSDDEVDGQHSRRSSPHKFSPLARGSEGDKRKDKGFLPPRQELRSSPPQEPRSPIGRQPSRPPPRMFPKDELMGILWRLQKREVSSSVSSIPRIERKGDGFKSG